MCGLRVVDVRTGKLARWLQLYHTIEELSNVAVAQGVRQPSVWGFKDSKRVAGFITVDRTDAEAVRAVPSPREVSATDRLLPLRLGKDRGRTLAHY